MPGLVVLVEHATCDGRTDRQTHDDSIYRASIVSRGKRTAHIIFCPMLYKPNATERPSPSLTSRRHNDYMITCTQT